MKLLTKLCLIGSPTPPWFVPVVIPQSHIVAYCTSTRNCEINVEAVQGKKKE